MIASIFQIDRNQGGKCSPLSDVCEKGPEDVAEFVCTPQELLRRYRAKEISGADFNRLSASVQVDSEWLLKELTDATSQHNWRVLGELLPFVQKVRSSGINKILGIALKSSFDDLVDERPGAEWGLPELIIDVLSGNDPRIIEYLAHVCCVPASQRNWYLDYRKAIDLIEGTTALSSSERVEVLRQLVGVSEIDEYIQEAIDRLQK